MTLGMNDRQLRIVISHYMARFGEWPEGGFYGSLNKMRRWFLCEYKELPAASLGNG